MTTDRELNLITIGYAKRALQSGSREQQRMKQYASVMGELHVIVFTRRSEKFPDKQQTGNLFLYATNAKTRPGMLWSAYQIGRKILDGSQEKKWVVSSQDPFETSLVGRSVSRGGRAIHHTQLHGDSFNPKSYRGSILQRLRVIYGKYVVRQTACIRVVSERLKRSLESLGVQPRAVTVLPIQADLTAFLEVGDERVYQNKVSPSFLYVGRFSPEKNISLIIKAFYNLTKEFPEASLTLLGSGPLLPTIQSQIASLGQENNIKFAEWTDDVSSVMAAHDVLCLASDHEGWGMVLLEAAAAGMPVITTDVGCAGEVIHDNKNGHVVPVGDVDAYTGALLKYYSDPHMIIDYGHCGHQIASTVSLSETQYLQKLVESYTSCTN